MKNEAYKHVEYWLEKIQNELYHEISIYMEKEGINQTQLAERLGVSKGYISQVLSGNFNHSVKKLIELTLAIGKMPHLTFESVEQYSEIQKVKDAGFRYQFSTKEIFDFNISNIFDSYVTPSIEENTPCISFFEPNSDLPIKIEKFPYFQMGFISKPYHDR